MASGLLLTRDEYRELSNILEKWTNSSQKKITLDSLISGWRNFVSSVERGYLSSIYEYTNDLSIRDILEDVMNSTRQSARSKIQEALRPWDESFIKATQQIDKPLLGSSTSSIWWFRIPLKLQGELRESSQKA